MTNTSGEDALWRVRALIRYSSLAKNIQVIRKLSGSAQVYAVVKADAYGHGTEHIAKYADAVDGFAVATIEEGIALRKVVAVDTPIMVLSEFNHPMQIEMFRQHHLELVIHKASQLEWLEAHEGVKKHDPIAGWIKFDTGMGRLGLSPDSAESLIQKFLALQGFHHRGLMSHLASADEPNNKQNQKQFDLFTKLKKFNLPVMSLCNSAGLLTIGTKNQTMVRPGILLYGVSPMSDVSAIYSDISPVMVLQSRLIDIKKLKEGESVGYGATWTARATSRIGIVSCGYADGYPRLAGNRGWVMIQAKPAAIIGRISMDTMAVNLSDHKNVVDGEIVELWGDNISVSQVAEWAETIPYELLCQVGNRVPRVASD